MDEPVQVQIHLTCRLCFGSCSPGEASSLIDTDLNRKLVAFASVQIQEIDGMPMIACSNCSNLINVAYNFKCQIEKSGQKFDQNAITGLPSLWPTMSIEKRDDDLGLIEAVSPRSQSDVSNICSLVQNEPSVNNHEQIILDIINSCTLSEAFDPSEVMDEEQLSEIMCSLDQAEDSEPPDTIQKPKKEESDASHLEGSAPKTVDENDYISEDEVPLVLRTKRHKCNYCVKSFADLDSLKKHSIVHKKVYVCYLCEEQFSSKDEVKRHGEIAHGLNRKVENTSGNNLLQSDSDEARTAIVPHEYGPDGTRYDSPRFICYHCSKHFGTRRLLVSHLRCHVGKNRLLRELEEEENCKEPGMGNARERTRDDKESSVNQSYNLRGKCSVLESVDPCRNSRDLSNIENLHHTNNQNRLQDDGDENRGLDKEQCHQCGGYFKNMRTLRVHLRNRSCLRQDENGVIDRRRQRDYERPFRCHRCHKAFHQAKLLAAHEERHKLNIQMLEVSRRYLCEICSKTFAQSATLVAHMRTHTGVRPYACKICDKAFTKGVYLKTHMRIHSGERPYICQYCSKAFSRANTLARHLTMHTGESRYQCQLCSKSYRQLNSLKEHLFIHTGQMPYACKFCSKKYNNRGSLHAHQKKCEKMPYACEFCSRMYKNSDSLHAHQNRCKSKHAAESVEGSPSTPTSTDSGVPSQDEDNPIDEFLIFGNEDVCETVESETVILEPQDCPITVINVPVQESLYTKLFEPLLSNDSDLSTVDITQLKDTLLELCTGT